MSTFKFTPKKGVLANLRKSVRASTATAAVTASNGLRAAPTINKAITDGLDSFNMAVTDVLDYFDRECQDFCVWGGYSRGSPTRLPFVFEMQYARPDAIAGAKVEGPARSAGGSSLAPAIARREAAGALAREV